MKDSMYTLLNDMDIQVENYEMSEVSSEEIKRWKKTFKQNKQVKRKRHMKGYVAAAALVLVCTLAFGPFQRETYAQIKTISYSVQEMLGMETDLSSYETLVGKTIAKDGVMVTVNDVVMDRSEMVVSYTVTADNLEDSLINCYLDIEVNGKSVFSGSAGQSWMEDSNNMVAIDNVTLDDVDVEKENYYKLEFYVYEEKADEEVISVFDIGKVGSVEFAATGEKLAAETTTVSLDVPCEFPNGDKLRFTKYSYNIMGPQIHCEAETNYLNYDVILKGEDDLGNEVEFYLTHFDSAADSWFILSPDENNYIREEASKLTLQIYAAELPEQSGENVNDYKSIGEPFTIQLR